VRFFPLILVILSLGCSTAKLAVHDVAAVATAPARATPRQWKQTAATAAAVGAALLLDEEIADLVRSNDAPLLDDATEFIEPFGGGHSDKVMAAFFLYGALARNDRAGQTAFDAFVSSIIASKGITPALKALTHRRRPHGSGDDESFPSNHATQAFTVATVIARHYEDRRWVRWLAYGVATGVGFARIYHDDHYTSDVIAGAAIGTFVGHTVVTANQKWRVQTDGKRVMVSLRW
jgi:membrane-associated phospholipid phosphatase